MAAPAIVPTSLYPRIRYGSPAVTVEFLWGLTEWLPSAQQLRGANLTGSGKIEYLNGRLEEACALTLTCETQEYAQLRRLFEDVLATGTQFECWVDRFTGSYWPFSQTLKDQNGLALVLNTGSEAYVEGTNGRALSLGGAQRLSVATAQSSATPTKTGFDDPLSKTEGVILLDVKPTWAANDSAEHYFIDTSGTTSNRLRLYKTSANALRFEILDNAAGSKIISGTPSWAANDRVEIVARWTAAGALQLWYAVNGGNFTELTTSSGAGTGIITTLGATLYVGSTNAAGSFAPGVYQGLAFQTRAFANPQSGLRLWRTVWRNYFPYAEVTIPSWQPGRVLLDPQIWTWPLVIRNGVL